LLLSLAPHVTHAWGTFVVDPYCAWAYHTVQAAVDAATAYTDESHADYVWISNDVTYSGQHIIINDPETEIRKKAVFALSQLPKDEGVPKLIEVARSHRDAAVRKQAIFWLGQSRDPRALAFFEQVLTQ